MCAWQRTWELPELRATQSRWGEQQVGLSGGPDTHFWRFIGNYLSFEEVIVIVCNEKGMEVRVGINV